MWHYTLCILYVPRRGFFEPLLVNEILKPNTLYHFHVAKTALNYVDKSSVTFNLEFGFLPLAQSKHPGSSEPEEEDKDEQRASWVFVHQYLENEAKGEVDVVERADAPVGGAEEHFAVQQDGSVHQVKAEEHQHAQQQLQVHEGFASVVGNTERCGGRRVDVPAHLPVSSDGVDDTDYELQGDHQDPLAGHGDTPVHLVVVNDEQLKRNNDTRGETC